MIRTYIILVFLLILPAFSSHANECEECQRKCLEDAEISPGLAALIKASGESPTGYCKQEVCKKKCESESITW